MTPRFRTSVLLAVAAVASLTPAAAQAATPKGYAYSGWVYTQSVMYMVNQQYSDQSVEWQLAFEANSSAAFAFYELFDLENGVRGASYEEARDHLDDALVALYFLADEGVPRNIGLQIETAQRYLTLARNLVNKRIAQSR